MGTRLRWLSPSELIGDDYLGKPIIWGNGTRERARSNLIDLHTYITFHVKLLNVYLCTEYHHRSSPHSNFVWGSSRQHVCFCGGGALEARNYVVSSRGRIVTPCNLQAVTIARNLMRPTCVGYNVSF